MVLAGSVLILILLFTSFGKESPLVRWACVVVGLATLQVGLGVFMAYVSLKPAVQVGHLTVAALLLGAETVLLLLENAEESGATEREDIRAL